jgi:hypothetical protein
MALNTFKYINVYYNKGDKKPYDVNGKPIAYLGQDFVGANEATIIRFYIGNDTGVINAVADVKRPDGEKAFALLDKVNTTEGVAWEFALTDWFCAKAGKLTIAFKAFDGLVTVVNNTIQSNNLRVIVSDIFNIDIGYAPNSVEDAPPFDPNDVATFLNALSGKLDKVGGINVVEALPTPTDGSLTGRWYLLKSGAKTVFPYIEFTGNITFSVTAPTTPTAGDYWYKTDTNVLSLRGAEAWAVVTSTNGTTTPTVGNSADLRFVNTTSSKLFITETLTIKDIGRLFVFSYNTPVEVELGVETLKLKSTGNGEVTADTAKLSWNQPNGTVNVGLYNDVNIGVGEDVIYYVKATGAITKGDVIQYAGYQGDHALAKRAVQSEVNANPKLIVGIAKQNIANGDFGYIAHFGKLEGVDTKSQAVNSFVWFDSAGSTAGNWTTTQPTAPNAKILLAVIIKAESSENANNGVLLVRPTIEPKLEELQNVLITSVANGNVLSYDGTKWVNSTRLSTAETDIANIEDGTTIVAKANADKDGNEFDATYLKKTTASATYIPLSQKAQPFGVATLGIDGRVLSNQIPGVVLSVEEYPTVADFPESGITTKVYLALDTQLTYLWSGTQYVALSSNLVLGETSATAYRGDRGKIAYDYSQVGHLPLAGGTVTGNLVVGGDLTISGTTTTIDTETIGIKDNLILINSNQTGTPSTALKGGLEIERGDLTNFQFVFDESDDRFKVGQVDSLQTVATRTDDGTIANRGITYFNTSTNRLENNANIVIDSASNVGIGTSTPAGKLQVGGTLFSSTHTIIGSSSGNTTYSLYKNESTDVALIGHDSAIFGTSDGFGMFVHGNKPLEFSTNSAKRMTITGGGNVGIGTTSPNQPLTVQANSSALGINIIGRATGNLGYLSFSNNANNALQSVIGNSDGNFTIDTNGAERMRIASDGKVGIGTTSPAERLDVNGWVRTANGTFNGGGLLIPSNANSASREWGIRTENSALGDFAILQSTAQNTSAKDGTTRFYISPTGNVGIGTTNPASKFEVSSDFNGSFSETARFTYSPAPTSYYLKIRQSNPSTAVIAWHFDTRNNDTQYDNTLVLDRGSVGIGTTSTFAKLNVTTNSASGYVSQLTNSNASGRGLVVSANSSDTTGRFFDGYSDSAGATRIIIYSNGNIQNTNNSYGAFSDIKLKENIVNAKPKLNDLNKVRVVNYNLKNDETKQIGVIAQELEKIFPNMVEEIQDTDKEGKLLGTTTKSVKYSVFVPMLIKAVQELTKRVEELESK